MVIAIDAHPNTASSLRTDLLFRGTTGDPAGLAPMGPGYGLEQWARRSVIDRGLPLIKRVVTGEFTS
jgi:hypothetical protein